MYPTFSGALRLLLLLPVALLCAIVFAYSNFIFSYLLFINLLSSIIVVLTSHYITPWIVNADVVSGRLGGRNGIRPVKN